MHFIYNFSVYTSAFVIWLSQFFSEKIKLFHTGRKDVFHKITTSIHKNDKTIWIHCASLGEYEQGVPLLKSLQKTHPNYKIVISFFSPSGYEIKKNSPLADLVVYLPIDTPLNAKMFIKKVHPSLAIFIKYEFWPNYLFQLKKNHIKTLLVSGLFRENQVFFKFYGSFMRKALRSFDHFFVQNTTSEILLNQINFTNVTISGDTRFDRVANQLQQDNSLTFIDEFKSNAFCIVCGSTWPEDDSVILPYLNQAPKNVKFIIAPHKIEQHKIAVLKNSISKKVVLFSEKEQKDLSTYQVFILDTIGLLTKAYYYADIAYVGGAMGDTGLHNILEPTTFGIPIVIGKNFKKFPEAVDLKEAKGLFSISNAMECGTILTQLIENNELRKTTGTIAKEFAVKNIGATHKIETYIKDLKL